MQHLKDRANAGQVFEGEHPQEPKATLRAVAGTQFQPEKPFNWDEWDKAMYSMNDPFPCTD